MQKEIQRITHPAAINAAFADAFNRRSLDDLLALYEEDACLRGDADGATITGRKQIAEALQALLAMPGRMQSRNVFCIERHDIALLRADWTIAEENGAIVASGRSAEIVRRQADGSWRYIIDHAMGAV